jgi:hypothetical protein
MVDHIIMAPATTGLVLMRITGVARIMDLTTITITTIGITTITGGERRGPEFRAFFLGR